MGMQNQDIKQELKSGLEQIIVEGEELGVGGFSRVVTGKLGDTKVAIKAVSNFES